MNGNERNRVVFFGSGSFPVETFKRMLQSDRYSIAGLVTSNDRLEFGDERLIDIAKENNIPYYVPKDLRDHDFLEWLHNIDAKMFCVISYKFLPKEVIEQCHGMAFNVHASLLPYLRGAAPISWAIRLGFKETGITYFRLSGNIDRGDIIESHKIAIDDSDTYGTLYARLSKLCAERTQNFADYYFINNLYEYPSVVQGRIPEEYEKSPVFHAPKLNIFNTTYSPLVDISIEELYNMIRSLSPNIGLTFHMIIRDDNKRTYNARYLLPPPEVVKEITFKVYDAKLLKGKEPNIHKSIITDWKNYLYIKTDIYSEDVVSVLRIQLPGKKILDIKEFLKGFQNWRKPNYLYGFL